MGYSAVKGWRFAALSLVISGIPQIKLHFCQ
jgi:hypothetical protein